MKALSIREPWAWLIVKGYKDIENRSWRTNYRGRFLVHAGLKFDFDGYEWVRSNFDISMPRPNEFSTGGILGEVELVDCVDTSMSPWFSGPYGFVLANPKQLPFQNLLGKLNFFEVS
jgi:hypothetical protein